MGVDKVHFRKSMPQLYAPKSRSWQPIEVPELRYLMIDGKGDPNTSQQYAAAVAARYSVAHPLKFASKRELGRDYVVPPLEGLWCAEDVAVFEARDKAHFGWTMMLMVPDWLTAEMVNDAVDAARGKQPDLPHDSVRSETLAEGRCMQLLHVGGYDDEGPSATSSTTS